VVLETEADNVAALALYEGLGFIREKRLHRFYLNGKRLLPVSRLRLCETDEALKPNDDRQRLVPACTACSTPHAEASTATHERATSDGTGSTTISRYLPCSAATAITATYARHLHHTVDSRPHHLIPSNCIAVLSRAITAYKRRHLCVGGASQLAGRAGAAGVARTGWTTRHSRLARATRRPAAYRTVSVQRWQCDRCPAPLQQCAWKIRKWLHRVDAAGGVGRKCFFHFGAKQLFELMHLAARYDLRARRRSLHGYLSSLVPALVRVGGFAQYVGRGDANQLRPRVGGRERHFARPAQCG
jgi:hypothetical protein